MHLKIHKQKFVDGNLIIGWLYDNNMCLVIHTSSIHASKWMKVKRS